MLVVVGAFTGLTYYCVVVLTCGPAALHAPSTAARLGNAAAVVVFTALVAMLSWSYVACALTSPGYVPPGWLPAASESVRLPAQFMPARLCDTSVQAR